MLCQAVDQLGGICKRYIVNKAGVTVKVLIDIGTKVAWLALPQVLRAINSELAKLVRSHGIQQTLVGQQESKVLSACDVSDLN